MDSGLRFILQSDMCLHSVMPTPIPTCIQITWPQDEGGRLGWQTHRHDDAVDNAPPLRPHAVKELVTFIANEERRHVRPRISAAH